MLAARQGDDAAEHREPKKHDAGKFIGPDDRPMEREAGDDSRKQDDDFHGDKRRRRHFDQTEDYLLTK